MEKWEETGDRKDADLCVKTLSIFEQWFWLVRLEMQVKNSYKIHGIRHWDLQKEEEVKKKKDPRVLAWVP